MANKPNFAAAVRCGAANINAANANRDGSGTVVPIFVAGANGSRIDRLVVTALGATTAGMIRFFLHDGTAYHFYREMEVTAITPSASERAFGDELPRLNDPELDLLLPNGWSLRASTERAEGFSVLAFGGDF